MGCLAGDAERTAANCVYEMEEEEEGIEKVMSCTRRQVRPRFRASISDRLTDTVGCDDLTVDLTVVVYEVGLFGLVINVWGLYLRAMGKTV